jgi:hypothetical protein
MHMTDQKVQDRKELLKQDCYLLLAVLLMLSLTGAIIAAKVSQRILPIYSALIPAISFVLSEMVWDERVNYESEVEFLLLHLPRKKTDLKYTKGPFPFSFFLWRVAIL